MISIEGKVILTRKELEQVLKRLLWQLTQTTEKQAIKDTVDETFRGHS